MCVLLEDQFWTIQNHGCYIKRWILEHPQPWMLYQKINSGTPRTMDAVRSILDHPEACVLFQKANSGPTPRAGELLQGCAAHTCQGTAVICDCDPVCCRSRRQAAASASRASYLASSVPGAWGCSAGAAEGAGPAPGPGSAPAGGQCCSAAGSQGGSGGWKAGDVSFLFTVPHRRGVEGKSSTFTPKLQREERVNTAGSPPQGAAAAAAGLWVSHPQTNPDMQSSDEESSAGCTTPRG